MERKCIACGKTLEPHQQLYCSMSCRSSSQEMRPKGRKYSRLVRCKVCSSLSLREFCSDSCYNGYGDGTHKRELYTWGDGRMSTAELIRKWHEEGDPPEAIAQALCRDINVVREVLNEDTGSL